MVPAAIARERIRERGDPDNPMSAGTPREEVIRRCETPMLAKTRAATLASKHRRVDWSTVKEAVMLEGLRAKFEQHPDLAARLQHSGDRLLVEHTQNDSYWGDGGDGAGKNRLGHLLMQVREERRRTTTDERAAASFAIPLTDSY